MKNEILINLFFAGMVSFNIKKIISTLIALRIAANINGVCALKKWERAGSESLPPKKGPIINPKPNVAPMSPNVLALFCGAVMSAIAACATDMFPPVMPSSARAAKSSGKDLKIIPKTNKTYERPVPIFDIIRIGFLPYLSESLPRTGADMNCMIGKIALNIPSKIYP